MFCTDAEISTGASEVSSGAEIGTGFEESTGAEIGTTPFSSSSAKAVNTIDENTIAAVKAIEIIFFMFIPLFLL